MVVLPRWCWCRSSWCCGGAGGHGWGVGPSRRSSRHSVTPGQAPWRGSCSCGKTARRDLNLVRHPIKVTDPSRTGQTGDRPGCWRRLARTDPRPAPRPVSIGGRSVLDPRARRPRLAPCPAPRPVPGRAAAGAGAGSVRGRPPRAPAPSPTGTTTFPHRIAAGSGPAYLPAPREVHRVWMRLGASCGCLGVPVAAAASEFNTAPSGCHPARRRGCSVAVKPRFPGRVLSMSM